MWSDWSPEDAGLPLGGKPHMRRASGRILLVLERTPTDRWSWTELAWLACVRVAEVAGGYRPRGTTEPAIGYDGESYDAVRHGVWPRGAYLPAQFQGVTAEDAAALADALDRMLAKLDATRDADVKAKLDPTPPVDT